MEAATSSRPLPQNGLGGPPATPSHPSLLPALSPSTGFEQTPAPLHTIPAHLLSQSRPSSAQAAGRQQPHPHSQLPPIPQPHFAPVVQQQQHQQNGHGDGSMRPPGNNNVFGAVMGPAPGQVPPPSPGAGNAKVYASVYSGIPVFEAMIRGISVMRRSADSWVNATQLLKVAGIPKSSRTKILEKEILTGVHEKVQGGYGKYQGTWVPLERGKDLAEQYGITAYVRPIFEFVPSPHNVAALPVSRDTPARSERKTPGQSVMNFNTNPMITGRVASPFTQHPHGGHQPPPTFGGDGMMIPGYPTNMGYPNVYYPHQQYDHGLAPGMPMTPSRSNGELGGALAPAADINGLPLPPSHSNVYIDQYGNPHPTYQGQHHFATNGDMQPPPAKRQRSDEGQEYTNGQFVVDTEMDNPEPEATEAADEEDSDDELGSSVTIPNGMRLSTKPIRPKGNAVTAQTRNKLINLFSSEEGQDLRAVFEITPETPDGEVDFDTIIDDQGHTALHWACALARTSIVTQLIDLGADIHRGNYAGETPLGRSVLTVNHYEKGTFAEVLELLSASIRTLDQAQRTVIHHIALIAGVQGRAASARAYMTALLEWVAKEQSAVPQHSTMDIDGRIPSETGSSLRNLVDVQDVHGDTALNVAARVGNKSLIKLLLDAGADKARSNKLGLQPADFGVEVEALKITPAEAVVSNLKSEVPKPDRKARDVQKNITSIFETINETFTAELTAKQTKLNAIEASVRHATKALAEKRQQVQRDKEAMGELEQLKLKVENVQRASTSLPAQDWTGRSSLAAEVTGERSAPAAFSSASIPPPPPFVGTQEAQIPERGDPGALVKLRRIIQWEDRIADVLEDRKRALEGESADKAVKYRKLVSLCTKVPVDKVDGSLDALTQAIESDGNSIDLGRISGFITRIKDVQGQTPFVQAV